MEVTNKDVISEQQPVNAERALSNAVTEQEEVCKNTEEVKEVVSQEKGDQEKDESEADPKPVIEESKEEFKTEDQNNERG